MTELRCKITVPASTANLGPGFDVLGMALSLYNQLDAVAEGWTSRFIPPANAIERLDVFGEGAGLINIDDRNFLVKSAWEVFGREGKYPVKLRLIMNNQIPVGRGLGSSASAIVAGLLLAYTLLDKPVDTPTLIRQAAEIEGHPDNILPVVAGGVVLGFRTDKGEIRYRRMDNPEVQVVLAVPDYYLPTIQARKVLPQQVPLEDAIFNLSRLAYLVSSLQAGDLAGISQAMQDRLHQPYRAALIPGLLVTIAAAEGAGAYGAALSGAGPTIMALANPGNAARVAEAMQQSLQTAGVKCKIISVPPSSRGAWVE